MKIRLLTASIIIIAIFSGSCSDSEDRIKRKAENIHRSVLTLDSHTDTPMMLGHKNYDIGKRNDARNRGGKIDFPRMKEGGLDAVFFAVFVGQGPRDEQGHEKAYQKAVKLFENIEDALTQHPDMAEPAATADEVAAIKNKGKAAVLIGIENGYPIGNDLSIIKEFYDRGARYITLAHTRNNDICDSSTDDEEHGGLSDLGKQVVHEMNRLGMMVDVSHISDKSFYDVLEITKVPVIASHSNARTVCDNPRNLTDEMLLALRENGGVVQVCILSSYVKDLPENPEKESALKELRERYNYFKDISEEEMTKAGEEWYEIERKFPGQLATVSDLADHIDHIVNLIGIDHVGIGTDFDGGGGLEDCFDVSEIGNITLELVRRGYSKKDISKIWLENFLRVFRAVQAGAEV